MPSISFKYYMDEYTIIRQEEKNTVSDIFDYVFNEGEYRMINNTKERLDFSIISSNRK